MDESNLPSTPEPPRAGTGDGTGSAEEARAGEGTGMGEAAPAGEGNGPGGRAGHAGMRRAGVGMVLFFALIPPVVGSVVASLALQAPGRVPVVLLSGFFGAVVLFLVATPLGRRSNQMQIASYRRLTEFAILAGMTAAAVVLYTLIIHLLLGWQQPWASGLLSPLFG